MEFVRPRVQGGIDIRMFAGGGRLPVSARGGLFFGIIFDAFAAYANMDVGLPPAPPMFQMADAAERNPLLAAAGFTEISERELDIVWPLDGLRTILDFIEKGAVRSALVYVSQTPEVQNRIREALFAAVEPYLQRGSSGIASPAVLVTATKA